MVTGSVLANSALLYILCGLSLLLVVGYALICVVKAHKRCIEAGISNDVIVSVVKSTAMAAIVPSIAILIGFLTLTVSLGGAWPWYRLSVIGSLSYESMAAQYAANGMGVTMSDILAADGSVFGAIMVVMSVGVCSGPIVVTLLAKKYSTGLMNAKSSGSDWKSIMVGCFMLAMFAVYLPIMLLTDIPTTLTMAVSFVVSIICGMIAKKAKWLNDFIMAIAMIVAMASSILWVNLFG